VVLPGKVECDLPVRIGSETVVLETLKRAEDGDAHVLRLYETKGRRTQCTLFLPVDRPVREANIMEEPGEEVPLTDGQVRLDFAPFEIKTLLLE
jgi:alpha-mannosidase